MSRVPYATIILRYVHDQVSGEFVNVGLALLNNDGSFLEFRTLTKMKRVYQFFPGARPRIIGGALRFAKEKASHTKGRISEIFKGDDRIAERLQAFADKVLPQDDSGLQWSAVSVGLTHDPKTTFERLFDRLVHRYVDVVERAKRSDDQVWRTFSNILEKRQVSARIEEHKVNAKLETVTFKHALKNGKWHLMEPVSFDLVNPEGVTDKAKRLLGEMTLLRERKDEFKLYFLVGKPSDGEMFDAYDKALKILKEVPCESAIYQESQAEEFAQVLAQAAAVH